VKYTDKEKQAMGDYWRVKRAAQAGDVKAQACLIFEYAAEHSENAKILMALCERMKARPWYERLWDYVLERLQA
jgi:hypothetical protein